MNVTSYKPGTPSWVDLGSPDPAATAAFYSGLFGWVADEGPPEFGGYRMCMLNDQPVAGLGPLMAEGQPSVWTSYFATESVDESAERVATAGGGVLAPPMDVGDIGRMAIFTDTGGAAFGVWQKGTFAGAGTVNEPGAVIWNELVTRDVDGAKDFYQKALGLGAKASDSSGDVPYHEFEVDGRSVAGMLPMTDDYFPSEVPPHWMVYFAVDDTDAAVAKAQELGGKVTVPAMDTPVGRMAAINDPTGATFSIIKMAS